MYLIEVSNLTKQFGGLTAVNGVDFTIKSGEIVGLIGPNGSGKTTIFNLLSGFHTQDKGRIIFKGIDILGLKPHQICRTGLVRTFQIVQPFSNLSVLENIMVGTFNRAESIEDSKETAIYILKRLGMFEKQNMPAKDLTIGDLKRLEVARALAAKPELLLLDEVMAGLNPTETEEFIELLKEVRNEGITIFIVEHVMKAIMKLSERIIVIAHGEKIAEGTPAEVSRDRKVIDAYLGEEYLA